MLNSDILKPITWKHTVSRPNLLFSISYRVKKHEHEFRTYVSFQVRFSLEYYSVHSHAWDVMDSGNFIFVLRKAPVFLTFGYVQYANILRFFKEKVQLHAFLNDVLRNAVIFTLRTRMLLLAFLVIFQLNWRLVKILITPLYVGTSFFHLMDLEIKSIGSRFCPTRKYHVLVVGYLRLCTKMEWIVPNLAWTYQGATFFYLVRILSLHKGIWVA